jgi:D-glycero-alpha-D-manno-heptose 1-phosphate guanylyltransferase
MSLSTAIILAGGLGTRLRSVVADVPKPLAPIQGRPFLEYLLDFWLGQGVNDFILSVGYKRDLIQSCIGRSYRGADVRYAIEDVPMGTGGAVIMATRQLREDVPFLVLNGDTFFAVQLQQLEAFAKKIRPDWLLSLFRNTDSNRYMGTSLTDAGKINSFVPDPALPLVNGGVYWVRSPGLLADCDLSRAPLSLEQQVFPEALAQGRQFYGLECTGQFIDIGVPEDYRRADSILLKE